MSTLDSGQLELQDAHLMRPSGDMHPGRDARPAVAGPGRSAARVPLLLIIGPPGVGKSSAARQVSRLLETDRIGFAYVDRDDFGVDGLLDADPLADLQPILRARVAAGAERLVVAWRIDSDAELVRFRAALPWAEITVCRLRAETGELLERIAGEQQSFQRLHLQSIALEMARPEHQGYEDILLATDAASPQVVAMDALRQWEVGMAPAAGAGRTRMSTAPRRARR
jgi:DNA polymerase III delta prime subunit